MAASGGSCTAPTAPRAVGGGAGRVLQIGPWVGTGAATIPRDTHRPSLEHIPDVAMSHAVAIAAADFFTGEAWKARGLVTHYVLFAIDLATRAVSIAGVTANPDSDFMAQVARNLTDQVDGLLRGKRFLVVDRDSKFDTRFQTAVANAGVALVKTAARAPNMNAFAERFVRSIKDECLSRMIFFGEAMLRRALAEFVAHYHAERNHQGLGNRLLLRKRPVHTLRHLRHPRSRRPGRRISWRTAPLSRAAA